MKVLTILLAFSTALYAGVPHLPLDLTFEESQNFYQSIKNNKDNSFKDPAVADAISGGEKMNSWLKLINEGRTAGNDIRLTSKGTQRGIPIDRPSKYGAKTIKAQLDKIKLQMPTVMKNIIYGKSPIVATALVSDEIFIKWARLTSKSYQTAVRYTGLLKWRSQYEARAARDVRGYYNLKAISDLDIFLSNHRALNAEEAKSLRLNLKGLCINNFESDSRCESELNKAYKKNDLVTYKKQFWNGAIRNWDRFFKIDDPRTDVKWSQKAPGVMEVTFKDPKNPEISNWLKDNVEDEFKWTDAGWALEMRYVSGGWGTAYLEFKKNVTPHVTGGNKIVMDANTDIQEYGVRWTIRHEYGHILRLPDCYHEFYDKNEKVFVNYQLDTTDLMCSRAGKMNKRIFEELKRVYLK